MVISQGENDIFTEWQALEKNYNNVALFIYVFS